MITYHELVDAFWASHTPTRMSWSRQYMAAVFTESPAQAERAAQSRAEVVRRTAGAVETPVLAAGRFYLAEDYHQKYYLRHDAVLMRELAALTPRQLIDSTVAARLNGYVAGKGTAAQLREELPHLRLSGVAAGHLEQLVRKRTRA